MSASPPHPEFDLYSESPPQVFIQDSWGKQVEDAKITFEKVLDGHYHGKPGYKMVACLLLTWQDDDMTCRETEVSHTVKIFADLQLAPYSTNLVRFRWTHCTRYCAKVSIIRRTFSRYLQKDGKRL